MATTVCVEITVDVDVPPETLAEWVWNELHGSDDYDHPSEFYSNWGRKTSDFVDILDRKNYKLKVTRIAETG